jgi:hypothetical protein
MPVNECIRAMILDRTSSLEIRKEAARQGMRSLRQDGWRLVQEGRTTLEEVLRATKDDSFSGNGNGNGNGNGHANGNGNGLASLSSPERESPVPEGLE